MTYDEGKAALIEEIQACVNDPVYFINNYVKLQGEVLTLNANQIEWVESVKRGDEIARLGADRATGRTTVGLAILLWKFVFSQRQTLMAVSHHHANSKMLRDQFESMYDSLPKWLQPKLSHNNKRELRTVTGNVVFFEIASINTARGIAVSLMFLDNALLFEREARGFFRETIKLFTKTGWRFIISS